MTSRPDDAARSRLAAVGINWRSLGIAALTGLGYYMAATIGYAFIMRPAGFAVVWPPSGFMLAVLLLLGRRRWAPALAGGYAGNVVADVTYGATLQMAFAGSAANSLESVTAAALLLWLNRPPFMLDTVRQVVALAVAAVVVSNAITALVGASVLASGGMAYWTAWFVWWSGDGLGMLIVAPAIVTWTGFWRRRATLPRLASIEGGLVFVAFAALFQLVLGAPYDPGLAFSLDPYMILPLLFWAAFRFGSSGAATATLLLAAVTLWNSAQGDGPFVRAGQSRTNEALQVYTYLALAGVFSLLTAALLRERQAAQTERERNAAFAADVARALTEGERLADVLNRCAGAMVRHLGATHACVWTVGAEHTVLALEGSRGACAPLPAAFARVPVGQTSLGRIAETRTPWSTNDAGDADLPDPDWVRRERLVSFAGYPLVLGGRVVGVMAMFGRDPLRAQALEPLASIARTIALGIERKGLEASRKRFADLLDAASDFVTIGRPYGPALYINPAARRALGIGDTEQIESLAAFRSPESKRHFDEVALPAALRDGSWRGEAEYVARDGRAIPVSQVLVSHRHAAAGTPLLSAISRDITDSKRAEERTRLLARAIESTTEMVGVTDLDNRFTFVNRAFLETYGYAADEVLGRTPAILQAPDEAGAAVKDIARAAHQGGWHGELVHRRRDGTELSVSLTSSVIRDDDDRPIGVLGVARDITDRLRAERAVRDAEERLEFALRASGVGVWEVNLTTGTVFWSETCERMHGLDTGAFPGRLEAFVESVLPDDRTQVQEAIDRAIRDRTDVVLEYRTQWPDNRIRQISSTGRFFYDDAGTPVRGAGIAVDITERRSLEDQLRQAQKMEAIGQLAGGIAHDFNNLLTAILGYAGLLGESLAPGDTRREDLDEIRQATDRAVALTRQLLAFSRKQILSPRVLRVGDVVSRLVPMLRRLLGETIDVKTVIADDGAVKADVGQLEQVLVNLSVNARDAMVDGGSLTIETVDVSLDDSYVRQHGEGSAGRFVMLSVADTGHGMDAATREHVFEPFFTTKPEGRGTGLGLSTVHGIVHQSGGHVWVYSEVGHGTVFKVYLPRTDEVETPPEPEDDIRVLRGTETILLVEDEDVVREFAHKVLTRQGYAVHALADPGQALAFARAHSGTVDLLLTDVVLPRTNGRHLAEAVSALHPEAGILYMSGYTDDAIVRHGVLEPGTRFLQKPFASDALLRKVRQVIEARRASG